MFLSRNTMLSGFEVWKCTSFFLISFADRFTSSSSSIRLSCLKAQKSLLFFFWDFTCLLTVLALALALAPPSSSARCTRRSIWSSCLSLWREGGTASASRRSPPRSWCRTSARCRAGTEVMERGQGYCCYSCLFRFYESWFPTQKHTSVVF